MWAYVLWAGCVSSMVRGEEGSSGLSLQSSLSVPHLIKERGDKRGMLSYFTPQSTTCKVGIKREVCTEPDVEAEMPPVPLKQPLAGPKLLLFSTVPEAQIFAYLRAKIILLSA